MNDNNEIPDPQALREFLAGAPPQLKSWADQQLAALATSTEANKPQATSEDKELSEAAGAEDLDDLDSDDAPIFKRHAKEAKSKAERQKQSGIAKINLVLVALLAAAIVIIVQQSGRNNNATQLPQGHPNISSSAMEVPVKQIDKDAEKQLKQQVEADANNVDSRRDLAKLYFDAGLYQDAITYFDQALELSPDDIEVLLMLGVSHYNLNNFDEAEQNWLRVTKLAPDKAEPWYNLGFLYITKTPADEQAANDAWNKVIEIEPDSELAASAKQHLENIVGKK